MKILIVLTSHDRLGDTDKKTGFWLEEFTAPYYVFLDAGATVSIASLKGGQVPVDPKSEEPDAQTESTARFRQDDVARYALDRTYSLGDLRADDYDAVFYAGGHGPLWDLAESRTSIALIESFYRAGSPVAAVCHGPAVLRHAMHDGRPLVQGKAVTGFSNSEEAAVGLTDVVPFLLEDELKRLGGEYAKGEDWKSHVVVDGKLVTGQNPASSAEVAQAVVRLLTT
jgi:putative intracellular protease/amidase